MDLNELQHKGEFMYQNTLRVHYSIVIQCKYFILFI